MAEKKLPLHIGFHYVERDYRMEDREVKILSQIPGQDKFRVENVKHRLKQNIGRQSVISGKVLRTRWDLVPHFEYVDFYPDGKKCYRSTDKWVIAQLDGSTMTSEDGMSFVLPEGVAKKVQVGEALILETINFSMVLGAYSPRLNEWLWRKSDEELLIEHEEFLESIKKRDADWLIENKEEFEKREAALPDWLRGRIETFHKKGKSFEGPAWGYEVLIAELAVMYAKLGDAILDKNLFEVSDIESDEIKEFARTEGTSGNQHSVALALAKAHLEDPEQNMAGTISGMAPIGGGAFYDR